MSDISRPERVNPFRREALIDPTSLRKRQLLQRVEELQLDPAVLDRANPTVLKLTVKDLNDLAAQFSGVKTGNRAVEGMSVEDIRNLEEVFTDFKLDMLERVGGRNIGDLAAVDVSCCCCTPCCCCAAAAVDPFVV